MIRKGDIHIWVNRPVKNLFGITDDFCRYLYMLHGKVLQQFLELIHGVLTLQAEYLLHLFLVNGTAFLCFEANASSHDDDLPALFIAGAHYIIIDYFRYFHNCS